MQKIKAVSALIVALGVLSSVGFTASAQAAGCQTYKSTADPPTLVPMAEPVVSPFVTYWLTNGTAVQGSGMYQEGLGFYSYASLTPIAGGYAGTVAQARDGLAVVILQIDGAYANCFIQVQSAVTDPTARTTKKQKLVVDFERRRAVSSELVVIQTKVKKGKKKVRKTYRDTGSGNAHLVYKIRPGKLKAFLTVTANLNGVDHTVAQETFQLKATESK